MPSANQAISWRWDCATSGQNGIAKRAVAAYLSARTALQVHGAIGYTLEHDLGLWLTKTRALQTAWGTQSFHRGRVLDTLGATR